MKLFSEKKTHLHQGRQSFLAVITSDTCCYFQQSSTYTIRLKQGTVIAKRKLNRESKKQSPNGYQQKGPPKTIVVIFPNLLYATRKSQRGSKKCSNPPADSLSEFDKELPPSWWFFFFDEIVFRQSVNFFVVVHSFWRQLSIKESLF